MRLVALFAALLATSGCVKSCACGDSSAPATQSPSGSARAPAAGAPGGWIAPQAAQQPAAQPSAAAGTGGTLLAEATNTLSWRPAPASPMTERLVKAKAAIEASPKLELLAPERVLGAVLEDTLGGAKADGPVSATTRNDEGAKYAVAARTYRSGATTISVKVTDTAAMPIARRAVSDHLADLGNDAAGNEHGLFVRNQPALVAGYGKEKSSRAHALIENRYYVQVMVRNAGGPDDALRFLEALDLGTLKTAAGGSSTAPRRR